MQKVITLSEFIRELQKQESLHGNKSVLSIGLSSGSNSAYTVRSLNNEEIARVRYIK